MKRLDDGTEKKLSQLVMKRRALLDAIDAAELRTWAEVWAAIRDAKTSIGAIAPERAPAARPPLTQRILAVGIRARGAL